MRKLRRVLADVLLTIQYSTVNVIVKYLIAILQYPSIRVQVAYTDGAHAYTIVKRTAVACRMRCGLAAPDNHEPITVIGY